MWGKGTEGCATVFQHVHVVVIFGHHRDQAVYPTHIHHGTRNVLCKYTHTTLSYHCLMKNVGLVLFLTLIITSADWIKPNEYLMLTSILVISWAKRGSLKHYFVKNNWLISFTWQNQVSNHNAALFDNGDVTFMTCHGDKEIRRIHFLCKEWPPFLCNTQFNKNVLILFNTIQNICT